MGEGETYLEVRLKVGTGLVSTEIGIARTNLIEERGMEQPRSNSDEQEAQLGSNEPRMILLSDRISHSIQRQGNCNTIRECPMTIRSYWKMHLWPYLRIRQCTELSCNLFWEQLDREIGNSGIRKKLGDVLSSHQSMVDVGHPQKGISGCPSWITRAVGRWICLTSMVKGNRDRVVPSWARLDEKRVRGKNLGVTGVWLCVWLCVTHRASVSFR